ncbi:AzlC family ABC transporter permease [Microlunatus sp. Y2014]|uniref:AzlC family ABC transporter permease n=1 Tax=Microlunatus sp. Y2014 TaxID=3418488 RepID=UPI003DA72FBF
MTRTASTPGPQRAERSGLIRNAIGIGVYAGTFGMAFGAFAATTGLEFWQIVVLSVVMFSGASQFAFAGVVAIGGAPVAAVAAAVLLAVRNAFYGVPLSRVLRRDGWRRFTTAQLVIDESTAMSLGQPHRTSQRFAFFAGGLAVFVLWNVGTVAGALAGGAIDPERFGLGAAAPAAFLALLWPALTTAKARLVAIGGGVVAFVLIPVAPAGVPVLAAALVALAAGLTRRGEPTPRRDVKATAR